MLVFKYEFIINLRTRETGADRRRNDALNDRTSHDMDMQNPKFVDRDWINTVLDAFFPAYRTPKDGNSGYSGVVSESDNKQIKTDGK